MRRITFLAIPLIALASPGANAGSPKVPAYVAAALADPNRPANNKEGNSFRLPAETLAFAGVRPEWWSVESIRRRLFHASLE